MSICKNCRGFTLIELIMVMLLVVILAAVAIPRFSGYGEINLGNAAVKVASDVRYAQNIATTTQERSRASFITASTYEVLSCAAYDDTPGACSCTGGWALATDPSTGGNFQVDLSADFSGVALATLVGDCIEFDSLGRPYYNAGCSNTASCNASSGSTLTLQYAAVSRNISVIQETGMISY